MTVSVGRRMITLLPVHGPPASALSVPGLRHFTELLRLLLTIAPPEAGSAVVGQSEKW
jgi:hypothetical protein